LRSEKQLWSRTLHTRLNSKPEGWQAILRVSKELLVTSSDLQDLAGTKGRRCALGMRQNQREAHINPH
jgi:hypothetical protein